MPDGSWKTLAQGTTSGDCKELKVTSTTAQMFQLHLFASQLINAGAGMTIDEFQMVE